MKKRRRRWSRQEKAEIVRRFFESDHTQQSFAAEIGIHPGLLAKWIQLARSGELPNAQPILVPVRVKPAEPVHESAAASCRPLEVLLSNGRVVRVPKGFDEATLWRAVKVLESC